MDQCALQWEQAAVLQDKLIAATGWYLHLLEVYRQEEKFAYRKSLQNCFTHWKKLQDMLKCVHCAPKGKNRNH